MSVKHKLTWFLLGLSVVVFVYVAERLLNKVASYIVGGF